MKDKEVHLQALDRGGRFQVQRLGRPSNPTADLYHLLMTLSLPRFLLLLVTTYFGLNLIFASLYWLSAESIRGGHPGSFADAFFFSVQTLATIGYGDLTPGNFYGHLIVALEACTGTLGFAVIAGLTFAKFSVPSTRVLFSRTLVIYQKRGQQVLELRLANERPNQIVDARVKLTLARNELGADGEIHRRLQPLALQVSETPLFALSFLVTHVLDAQSPLAGISPEDEDDCNCEVIVTMTGIDDALGQTVYARAVYTRDDIRWGQRFASTLRLSEKGQMQMDLGAFHDTIPA